MGCPRGGSTFFAQNLKIIFEVILKKSQGVQEWKATRKDLLFVSKEIKRNIYMESLACAWTSISPFKFVPPQFKFFSSPNISQSQKEGFLKEKKKKRKKKEIERKKAWHEGKMGSPRTSYSFG